MTFLLETCGHEVFTVYDGEAALQTVMKHRPSVAILDIGMPKMNGYEVAQAVRQARVGTVLVAVSGWGSPSDVRRAKDSGFQKHFTKPADFAEIESIIRSVAA